MTPEERARKCLDDFVLITDKNLDEIVAAAIRDAEAVAIRSERQKLAVILREASHTLWLHHNVSYTPGLAGSVCFICGFGDGSIFGRIDEVLKMISV